MVIESSGKILGAKITGIDLNQPISQNEFYEILKSLSRYGVLHFPKQSITPQSLKDFSAHFGSLQIGVSGLHEPGFPEVSVLSNIVENGKPIGIADAGQDWHTDMSYNNMVGYTNVLHALQIPRRNGKALGSTHFANMMQAYEDLPESLKVSLSTASATHDFNKFWENMRARPGSNRPALTPEQRAKRPPSVHPIFMTHPITGKKILYCNPGYAIRINEFDQAHSDTTLQQLFDHQLQEKYQYTHEWNEGDLLMWDHLSTLHNAWPDYSASEHRLIKRCQVMADKVFDPHFIPAVVRMEAQAS
jgi:taurine dioxygenase